MKLIIFIFILNLVEIYGQLNSPNNPCPSVFQYSREGQNWFGYITVPAPHPLKNIARISANFSVEGTLSSEGKLVLHDVDNALKKIENAENLIFVVSFARHNYLPTVTHVEYNGDVICSGQGVSVTAIGSVTNFWLQYTYSWSGLTPSPNIYYTKPPHRVTIPQTSPPIYTRPPPRVTRPPVPVTSPPIYTNPPPIIIYSPKPVIIPPQQNTFEDLYTSAPKTTDSPVKIRFKNYRQCGLIRKKRNAVGIDDEDPVKRIINGTSVLQNAHPWLVALFDLSKTPSEFFCAGNLISSKHVITAAHCTIKKDDKMIEVRLGVHDLANLFHPGTQRKRVITTLEHPNYKDGNAYADVSIIVLDSEVPFTDAVKPICLWNYDSDFRAIVGYIATIMGWGITEQGRGSMVPLKTDVTISDKQKCQENSLLKNMVTDETFCAGARSSGPCLGDSGGGLFLSLDGKWYLRGIISTSIADRYTSLCDANAYSVYVDTAKYLEWISNNMHT